MIIKSELTLNDSIQVVKSAIFATNSCTPEPFPETRTEMCCSYKKLQYTPANAVSEWMGVKSLALHV